jgi:hydrogenase maturation protein HypF
MSVRKRLTISGVVQGVGFRPFVWRRATGLGLAGWVENRSGGVVAEVQGPAADVAAFIDGLAAAAPPLAVVERVAVEEVTSRDESAYEVRASAVQPGRSTPLPADIATCHACLAEVNDPGDRRFGYPFTNCTDCGPRYTIIEDLPYDRAATTMRSFGMCPDCAAEYRDPASRRFHAQSNACPTCGPTVWFCSAGGVVVERSRADVVAEAAIETARELLVAGGILALKGIGGFHLVCDATNDMAVARLREHKHRMGKPLAVMVQDVAAARAFARVNADEERLLESRERPIVLLRKVDAPMPARGRQVAGSGAAQVSSRWAEAAQGSSSLHRSPSPPVLSVTLALEVAPGNDFVGVLLPYSPLHHLLIAGLPPLVMTSGNLSEESIVSDNAAAARVLGPIADGFLFHDRDIHMACDDSVVRCVAGGVMPIRRSRGYAPLPVPLGGEGPSVLAVGGELKSAVCITRGDHAFMSQHIGDLGNLETLDALGRTVGHLLRLFRVEPEAVVADLHPGYLSTEWARRFAGERGIPFMQVQHHEAHVAALRAEARLAETEPLIGVCFDGTGYGRDGMIQGGEFFVGDGLGLRRAAHLDHFPLPGGDASIRHPWRAALAVLHAAGIPWHDRLPSVRAAHGAGVLRQQLQRSLNCVATSSMGRLFDAVASLAGARHEVSYEAEAALNLEALAVGQEDVGGYAFAVPSGANAAAELAGAGVDGGAAAAAFRIGWQPVIAAVVSDVVSGVPPALIAARFHAGVAAMIVEVCTQLRAGGAGETVGLTGGVFQNAVLTAQASAALAAAGFRAVMHRVVPPNDGGLALGQVVLGRESVRATGLFRCNVLRCEANTP